MPRCLGSGSRILASNRRQAKISPHPPRLNTPLVLLAVVAVLAAGAGFARDMIVHHGQAVQMAEIIRNKTDSDPMRLLASDISLTQQGQIGIMQGWLQVWGLPKPSSEPAMAWMGHPTDGPMPGMAIPDEINRLSQLPPDGADELF